jgi:glucose/arabinose dehydrogenase
VTRIVRLSAMGAMWIVAASGVLAHAQADPSAPIVVKGTEHIAWDQTAPRGGWIVGFRFIAYVDDQPQALPDASCTPIFCSQCGCAAPLPPMAPGTHRIEIVARDVFGSESSRSAPIFVALGSSVVPSSAIASLARSTSSDVSARVEVLTASLDGPSAIAVAPDGRVFIAERSGSVAVWKDGRVESPPATTIGDVATGPDVGLVGLTLDPDFSTNARVFVAYSSRDAAGAFANRIVRYREVAGIFGEAAVIFDDRVRELPARTPRIRFGPDRKLYVLFPSGSNAAAAGAAAYAGKVLRLNEDGSTPADNPGATPVIDGGPASSTAFDWQPETHMLWRSDRASAMAFYADGRNAVPRLVEVGLDGEDDVAMRWFGNDDGRVSDLVVGPDGALYFCGVNKKTRAGVLARVLER